MRVLEGVVSWYWWFVVIVFLRYLLILGLARGWVFSVGISIEMLGNIKIKRVFGSCVVLNVENGDFGVFKYRISFFFLR